MLKMLDCLFMLKIISDLNLFHVEDHLWLKPKLVKVNKINRNHLLYVSFVRNHWLHVTFSVALRILKRWTEKNKQYPGLTQPFVTYLRIWEYLGTTQYLFFFVLFSTIYPFCHDSEVKTTTILRSSCSKNLCNFDFYCPYYFIVSFCEWSGSNHHPEVQ